jgi:hypothetical protein
MAVGRVETRAIKTDGGNGMKIDSRILLQLALLGLLEEGLHVSDVIQLASRTAGELWIGLNQEERKKTDLKQMEVSL